MASVSAITASATQTRANGASQQPSRCCSARRPARRIFWMSVERRSPIRPYEWGRTRQHQPIRSNASSLDLGRKSARNGREAGVYFKWGRDQAGGNISASRPQVFRAGFEGRRRPGVPGRAQFVPGLFTDTNGTAEPGTMSWQQPPFQRSGLNRRDQNIFRIGAERPPGSGLDGGGFASTVILIRPPRCSVNRGGIGVACARRERVGFGVRLGNVIVPAPFHVRHSAAVLAPRPRQHWRFDRCR